MSKRLVAPLVVTFVGYLGAMGLATADVAVPTTKHASAQYPGTTKRDTMLLGKTIKRIRTRYVNRFDCFAACEKMPNCDGVTLLMPRSRNRAPVSCLLMTGVKPRHIPRWMSWIPRARCASDAQCSDRKFCNGVERCNNVSGSLRCHPGHSPCNSGETCDNRHRRCKQPCHDRDRDGFEDAACGGDDCNDGTAWMYPGRAEVCDNRDNDCVPCTVGNTDADHDGFVSASCSNPLDRTSRRCSSPKVVVDRANRIIRGRDCDDSNPAIRPGSIICDAKPHLTRVCVDGRWVLRACPPGTNCVRQPNGTGRCSH